MTDYEERLEWIREADKRLPDVEKIERLALNPGDAVVVTTQADITMQQAADIKARIYHALGVTDPSALPVIVLGSGTTLQVLTAADTPIYDELRNAS